MIAHPPSWPDQALPYVMLVSSRAVSDSDLISKYLKSGSGSALRSTEEQRLNVLENLTEDWDGRGSPRPSADAIAVARKWLDPLRVAASASGSPWRTPHISASDSGEVTFEWWRGDRKITMYFNEHAPEFVKVWGPHIFDQMESGDIQSSESFRPIWLWLNAT